MSSLLPGFEYDIFISYRHNDNSSGWVTDFVDALRQELAAAIKEPLSIYFDKNPHDGLLETDSVNKSLEGKLKCLIFIPIISQTYCDPKSFAWQHEFCPFNKLSQLDMLGRDIKLVNGNVRSRILPIKIHDIDAEDRIAIEKEIGGALRAIEFIFKSAGVNRPLRPLEEHPQDNLNHTFYRDQANKVANAIKAIVQAVKAPSSVHESESQPEVGHSVPPQRQPRYRKLIIASVVIIFLVSIAFWKYNTRPGEAANDVEQSKSLIILPFEDISPKKDQTWFSDGLTEELLHTLSSIPDLKLISRTTSFSFKDKGLSAKKIADSLGVAHVLEGSVRKVDNQLRITVQLIKANDDSHLWSHVYDYTIDSVFKIQGDISKNVANTLNLLLDSGTRELMFHTGTTSIEAYQEYLKGRSVYREAHTTGKLNLLVEANTFFEKAIQMDPNFARAYYDHSDVFSHSLLGSAHIESFNTLSEREQYDKMMEDLTTALALTQLPGDKVAYAFASDFFSNDWSRLHSYFEVKENWESGWEQIMAIAYPEKLSRRFLQAVETDRLDEHTRYCAALSLANMNKEDTALLLYKIDYTKSVFNDCSKSFLYFRKNDYAKALHALNNNKRDIGGYYAFLELLNGRYKNRREDLDRDIASYPIIGHFSYSPIIIYNALGEYHKADSVASLIDSRLTGHCSLANNVFKIGLHFHLNSTPNFAARLRELGIDLDAYEKKNYKKIPIIKVEN